MDPISAFLAIVVVYFLGKVFFRIILEAFGAAFYIVLGLIGLAILAGVVAAVAGH